MVYRYSEVHFFLNFKKVSMWFWYSLMFLWTIVSVSICDIVKLTFKIRGTLLRDFRQTWFIVSKQSQNVSPQLSFRGECTGFVCLCLFIYCLLICMFLFLKFTISTVDCSPLTYCPQLQFTSSLIFLLSFHCKWWHPQGKTISS